MYILKNKINSIKRFLINNSYIVIIKANKEILLNNRIIDIDDLISVSFLNTEIDIFLLLNLKDKKLMCDRNLKKLHQFKKNTLIYNEIVYQNQNNKLTSIDTQFNADGSIVYNWVILDILKNKIIKNLNLRDNILGFFYTYKDTIIYRTNNENDKISAFDYVNNKILWQFDLSQLGTFQDYHNEQQSYKVEKILGIHNEHLYVALNGSLLLELDIATGKITHKWHHLPEKYKEYPDDDFSARLFDLDKANNALVCLSGRRYDSINLQTKEYNSVYIGEELKKYDIVSIRHQGDFTNEHISAVAHLKNDTWFQDGIVMFNRKTYQIDFFYKDETFTTGTASPKLAGNKLYQLDLDGNLYIFEKTTQNT